MKKIPSANMKAQFIAAMLGAGRYLFVLDGLEVLQYQDGDMYGSIRSSDLKVFLEFFSSPDHESFCLVTSRAPLVDMISFSTYKHRDVDRLSPQDSRNLLRNLGIQGKDEELDNVVKDWDGHALTLSLLASYLKDHYGGDIRKVQNIPPPTADELRYERVHRVLRRYDEHLEKSAKAFLKLLSVFRTPVDKITFELVFRAEPKQKRGLLDRLTGRRSNALNTAITVLEDSQFQTMVDNLVAYRILRYQAKTGQYTAHPLIRAHYSDLLAEDDRDMAAEAHKQIKDYYLTKAQDMPDRPSLKELMPLIEAVHHACQCGACDEAFYMYYECINRGYESYVLHKLSAWETGLEIMLEFFHKGDISKEPIVSTSMAKGFLLGGAGICLDNIGQGLQAERLFKRALDMHLGVEDWINASMVCQNLSELYSRRGELIRSLNAAEKALELTRRAKFIQYECFSLVSSQLSNVG